MWNLFLKNGVNELIYKTVTDLQTQKTNMVTNKKSIEVRSRSGVWDQQIQTTIRKIDKQQGAAVQHRDLYSISCEHYNGKEPEKM